MLHARAALRPQLRRGHARRGSSTSPIPTAPARCPPVCDPLKAGRYLCDVARQPADLVDRLFAGLRTRSTTGSARAAASALVLQPGFRRPRRRRPLSAHARSAPPNTGTSSTASSSRSPPRAAISTASRTARPGVDPVRLTDRFFLGSPQIRGFDIRGVGPRVQRIPYIVDRATDGTIISSELSTDADQIVDDALGGRAYYLARAELEIPLGSGVRELGLRPSIFVDVGAAFGRARPRADRHRARPARSRRTPAPTRPG